MYNEINQQMEEAQQQIFRLKKVNSMLEELTKQQKYIESRAEKLKGSLDKENADLNRLENKSLAYLFYSVLGKIGERVEKERREALAAKLKFDQAVSELEQVNYQIEQLRKELEQYRNCQRVYDSLYEKKKELLMASNSETAQSLMDLTEQLNISGNNCKEIAEAIEAGNVVVNHIGSALTSLDKAEGWGTWDMLGGGLVTDMIKHSHIDEAKSEADMVQQKLSRFRAELADVKINNNIHFETDGFGKFADFFFDGLIADWCMQSRINESIDSVQNVKNQVQQVLNRLRNMESMEAAHMEELQRKMRELIAKA